MVDYGVREIQFDDDEFLANHNRANEICNLLEKEASGLRWCCFARADRINEHLLARMKASGCWQIKFGIESGSQEILDRIESC